MREGDELACNRQLKLRSPESRVATHLPHRPGSVRLPSPTPPTKTRQSHQLANAVWHGLAT